MATRRLLVEILGDDASLQAALGRSLGATRGFGDRLMATGARIQSVGKTLTTHLTLPIVALGAASGKAAVDFQNSMELLHTQAGVGQKAVADLSKGVLALAGPTATAPDELSAGLYHLASQGLRGKESLDALRMAAEGAKLGQANLEDVTNALGAVIVSQIGGVHSYGQAMGELNKIVGTGDMRMQDLADAMGTGLPANAKIAGVSLTDVGGALATFGDNNIRGAKAGTLLNSTLRIMSAPSGAAQKALASVGISADELGNKLRGEGLIGALTDLKGKMEAAGLSATQQGILLTQAFGGRQANGVKVLIDELERLRTKTREVGQGGAAFGKDWDAYTKTTAYHLASMGAQMQATGVTIGTVLLPVVAQIADVIGNLASKFEALSPGVQKAILVFAGIAAAIGPVVFLIGSLKTALGFLFSTGGLIFLGVAALAALVAAIAAAVIWPNKLKDVLEKMGLSAHAAGEVVRGLQDVFHVVAAAGEALVGIVRDNWSTISAIISGVVAIVKDVVTGWVSLIEAIWRTFGGTLTDIARTEWGYIRDTIHNVLEVIRGIVDVVTGLIHGNWSKVWQGIKEITGGVLDQIENMVRAAAQLLGDAARLAGEALVAAFRLAWSDIRGAVSHGIGAVVGLVKALPGKIVGALGNLGTLLVNAGMSLIDGLIGGIKSKLGELGHLAGSIGGFIKSLKGPLPKDLVLLQPEGAGIIQGLMAGMQSKLPALQGLASSIAPALRAQVGAGGLNVPAFESSVGSLLGASVPDGGGSSLARAGGITAAAAGGAAFNVTFNVTVEVPGGFVGNGQQLGDAVATSLSRWARSNGRTDLRRLLGAPV